MISIRCYYLVSIGVTISYQTATGDWTLMYCFSRLLTKKMFDYLDLSTFMEIFNERLKKWKDAILLKRKWSKMWHLQS